MKGIEMIPLRAPRLTGTVSWPPGHVPDGFYTQAQLDSAVAAAVLKERARCTEWVMQQQAPLHIALQQAEKIVQKALEGIEDGLPSIYHPEDV